VNPELEALQITRDSVGRRAGRAGGPATRRRRPSLEVEAGVLADGPPAAFTPCEPDATIFPHRTLARLVARNTGSVSIVGEAGHPAGLQRLRQALAAHLTLSRGVTTDADRIIIVSGARQALHLAAETVLDPGDRVWCEDPGYPAARVTLTLAGARVAPVPVDDDGLDVDAGARAAPDARAAYVTPSHQFPTGAVMGMGRRLSLLDWAARNDAWILEDDYDSEFCYGSRPLPALQGLDEHDAVIYIGTLNKVTYPGMRLGYLVVPDDVVDPFVAMAAAMSVAPPAAAQAAFADFVADGHLAQHIARMRGVYEERRQLLLTEIERHAGDRMTVAPETVGMNVLGTLRHDSAERVAGRGRARGLDLRTLAGYALARETPETLVLGYTHLDADRIRAAARVLGEITG
jgi:GntR family transcriptional regulator/MocR family aminotransferase